MAMRAFLMRVEQRLARLEAIAKSPPEQRTNDAELALATLIERVEALEAKSHTHSAGRPAKVEG